MIDRKILAVKNSWSYVLIDREETGEAFYQKLFELDPTLYPLFQGDIKLQAKKLINMITLMVARLQKLDDIRHEIGELGKRHVTYGTIPAHYQTVGKALLYTLEDKLGARWSEEMREAWTEVYLLFANAMMCSEVTGNSSITSLHPV